MKKSMQKKLEKRRNNLPGMFIDSSVFLELLLGQPKHEDCLSFFNRARYKYRLATSVLALGEVINTLRTIEDVYSREKSLTWFTSILEEKEVEVFPISRLCIKNSIGVLETDDHLDSHDLLILTSALTENFATLITLDSDFTKKTGGLWHLKVKHPEEA